MKIFLRAENNYDTREASIAARLTFVKGSGKTQKHQKQDADINVLVKRFGLTGSMPQGMRLPMYGDFSQITTYQDALHQVMMAEGAFMMLPAEVRNKFRNDAGLFVEFCLDPKNQDELEKMGLINKRERAAETKAPLESKSPAKAESSQSSEKAKE